MLPRGLESLMGLVGVFNFCSNRGMVSIQLMHPLVKDEAHRGTTWKICPTQSQWQNGLAEQAVHALKDTLRQVTTGSSLNFAELFCLLQKIANTIND